jgi:anti-anti-sigma regulatory factor
MNITLETVQAAVPVTVLTPQGDIDASNFNQLVSAAQKAYEAGARDILLDLSQTPFLSSSGLVALHSISLLLRGEAPLDPESGWSAIHQMEDNLSAGVQQHMKLLNPQPRVQRTLERSGLTEYFAVFTDRQDALASFSAQPLG